MISGLQDYFEDVLLSDKLKHEVFSLAASKGHLLTLDWALDHDLEHEAARGAITGGHLRLTLSKLSRLLQIPRYN